MKKPTFWMQTITDAEPMNEPTDLDNRDESPERDERLTTTDWSEVRDTISEEDKRERTIRADED